MHADLAISLQNVSKRYVIGQRKAERYTALRDVLTRRAASFVGAGGADPRAPGSTEDFWALRDVSLDIKRGDAVAIIGRNGAGKSTLLKILSRITEPTEGKLWIRGRVVSLLEVGTGFHPELTGRENIFLNGAILGMTRIEIRSRLDEIVAFANVERFLDTPVKRYSSGMYVRLAFAVAAHVEPDVLIVDEVLAVGDAEFQKKCLGKMQGVSQGGRTVLFVSHNMAAVKSLTTRGLVLNRGRTEFVGSSHDAVEHYTRMVSQPARSAARELGSGVHTSIVAARLLDARGASVTQLGSADRLRVEVVFRTEGALGLSLELFLLDHTGSKIGLASLHQFHGQSLPARRGTYRVVLDFAPLLLAAGNYSMDVTTSVVNATWDHYVASALEFEVPFSNPGGQAWNFQQSYGYGALALLAPTPIEFEPIEAVEQ